MVSPFMLKNSALFRLGFSKLDGFTQGALHLGIHSRRQCYRTGLFQYLGYTFVCDLVCHLAA